MNELAPIVLFVYNRPWHSRQVLESLSGNFLADVSKLYIYADGPKANVTEEQLYKINETRNLIREKKWCKEIEIIERSENMGLANSIITGVTEIVNKYGKVIVLEDDFVTSVGFLKYMNKALSLYEKEESVMHISGYMFPVKKKLPETFFYNATSIWGWGTWQRAWKGFSSDAKNILDEINASDRLQEFTYNNLNGFDAMLRKRIGGLNESWDVCWHSSVFLLNGFCLHPHKSLVRNIGNDNSGVHCNKGWWSEIYNKQKIVDNINVEQIEIKESEEAREAMKKFYISLARPPLWIRLKEKMKSMLNK